MASLHASIITKLYHIVRDFATKIRKQVHFYMQKSEQKNSPRKWRSSASDKPGSETVLIDEKCNWINLRHTVGGILPPKKSYPPAKPVGLQRA